MNSFLPGANVGVLWSPSNAPSSALEHPNCVCVFSNIFQFEICPIQLQDRTFRIMVIVQMELPPVMCLSEAME